MKKEIEMKTIQVKATTHHRLKLKSFKKGVKLYEFVDELSKLK